MPSGGNHPNKTTQWCPICLKNPEKKLSDGGYEYFSCPCGEANTGWTTADAISNWNYLVDRRNLELQNAIAKKLGVLRDESHGE